MTLFRDVAVVLLTLYCTTQTYAQSITPAPSLPGLGKIVAESAGTCAGIIYDPPTWCQAESETILYSTISGQTGSGMCAYTTSPTATVGPLGILSRYEASTVSSCLSLFGLTAIPTVSTSSAAASPTSSSATPSPTGDLENCTVVFEPSGWPGTKSIPNMPVGLDFQILNPYSVPLSSSASCPSKSGACDQNDPPSKWNDLDSQLPLVFKWSINTLDKDGDMIFFYEYDTSNDIKAGQWQFIGTDWSKQQYQSFYCGRVHANCTAELSYQTTPDAMTANQNVTINILGPDGKTSVGGETVLLKPVHKWGDTKYMTFMSSQLQYELGFALKDTDSDIYFVYGQNGYTAATSLDKSGKWSTRTSFDCYHDGHDAPWLQAKT